MVLGCAGADATGAKSGNVLIEIELPEGKRSAWVHAPPDWTPDRSWPAIVMFHGGTGNTGLTVADLWRSHSKGPYVFVFPNGQLQRPNEPGWGNSDPAEVQRDITFIRKLMAETTLKWNLDPQRLFAVGHSNGANMTFTLACEAADLFHGFAPVSQLFRESVADSCRPSTVRPFLHSIGASDPKARYQGHSGALSAEESVQFWVKRAGCTNPPETTALDQPGDDTQTEFRSWTNCATGGPVQSFVVRGGGHAWPGSGHAESTNDFSGTDAIIRFFDAVSRDR